MVCHVRSVCNSRPCCNEALLQYEFLEAYGSPMNWNTAAQDRLIAAGIGFAFPTRDIYIRSTDDNSVMDGTNVNDKGIPVDRIRTET